MNKRGFVQDSFYITAMLFLGALGIVLAFFIYGNLNQAFIDTPGLPSEPIEDFTSGYERFPTVWDYGFLFILVVVYMSVMILSYLLPTNPAFYVIVIFILMAMMLVAGFLSNAWFEIMTDTPLGISADNFPIMSFIINNYVMFVLLLGFLSAMAFYAKSQTQGGFQ